MKNLILDFVNAVTLLAALSFVFYFVGYVYEQSYFHFVDLNLSFFEFQYHDLVMRGVLTYIGMIPLIALIAIKIFDIHQLKRDRKKLNEHLTKLISIKDSLLSKNPVVTKDIEEVTSLESEVSSTLNSTEDRYKKVLKTWCSGAIKLLFLFFFIVGVVADGVSYLLSEDQIPFLLNFTNSFSSGVLILIIYFLYKEYKSVIQGDFFRVVFFYPTLVLVLMMFPPLVSGYVESKAKLEAGTFRNVRVFENTTSYDAQYIYSNEHNYLFINKGIIYIVPHNRISRIELK